MPRIPPLLVRQASALHPLLAPLLRQCRSLQAARNEFRWIREHVDALKLDRRRRHTQLHKLCVQRGKGVPLQYLLGTEFFGDLELLVRPGVLIPRPETAVAVEHLCARIARRATTHESFRVLDLCTGSGCIAHLVRHELEKRGCLRDGACTILGVDVSERAVALARENGAQLAVGAADRGGSNAWPEFVLANVLAGSQAGVESLEKALGADKAWEVIVCNPPYVSVQGYSRGTERSVQRYEPVLALVPPSGDAASTAGVAREDTFYDRVLGLADQFATRVLWFEVGDFEQAVRVLEMARTRRWKEMELWRDDPGTEHGLSEYCLRDGTMVQVCGSGQGRSVFLQR